MWTMHSALVTGGAGFIGSHLVDQLLAAGWRVTALDNFDSFYDPAIKREYLLPHAENARFRLLEADICDRAALRDAAAFQYDVIVHLAAKAGVRPSIEDPLRYQEVNVSGTQNVLELARELGVRQFVFASSSSVYGINENVPWREDDPILRPISPYASTKISGELLGHVYAHLYGIRFIALRFFTVYGPRQRPDLAFHKFAGQMLEGKPVPVYGDGSTRRDYTFIGDIVNGILSAMTYDRSNYEIVNLGCGNPVLLIDMIRQLERSLGARAILSFMKEQPGDVPQTYASIDKACRLFRYEPKTSLAEGVTEFARWLLRGSSASANA